MQETGKDLLRQCRCHFLVNNQQVTCRTKHIDVHYHFVRDLMERGEIEFMFVPGDMNISDGLTKNLGGDVFKWHTEIMLCGTPNTSRESVENNNILYLMNSE